MLRRFGNERGFTLMELLISVAIVVILAGVGIPIYIQFQARAKASEANTNLNGIKLSQEGYKLSNGGYQTCAQHPAGTPDQNAVAWTGNADFNAIGFSTNGPVLFKYAVAAVAPSGSAAATFTAEALGDTDGDGDGDGDGDTVFYLVTDNTAPTVAATGYTPATSLAIDGTPSDD